ncbi:dihydrodipicolinate synthase family protein [Kribbella sp. NBC_00482]|uniref:dihydrodipicolinate synthase family protein n=1 Tax=Kribbella sp. NBC_00482 TaxID=2975968 RepID=UPI002E17126E
MGIELAQKYLDRLLAESAGGRARDRVVSLRAQAPMCPASSCCAYRCWRSGVPRFISVTISLAPSASAKLHDSWANGDLETARLIHFGLHLLVELWFVETNPAPSKYVMRRRGLLTSTHIRPPRSEPIATWIARIARIDELLAAGAEYLLGG